MSLLPNLSATETKEEIVAIKKAENLLPRTVLRSNAYSLLDGEWIFALDSQNEGVSRQWYLAHDYTHKANWFGSVEQHLAQAKGEAIGKTWDDKVVVRYQRTFPLLNREDPAHQMLQLTFGACGYETQV